MLGRKAENLEEMEIFYANILDRGVCLDGVS